MLWHVFIPLLLRHHLLFLCCCCCCSFILLLFSIFVIILSIKKSMRFVIADAVDGDVVFQLLFSFQSACLKSFGLFSSIYLVSLTPYELYTFFCTESFVCYMHARILAHVIFIIHEHIENGIQIPRAWKILRWNLCSEPFLLAILAC